MGVVGVAGEGVVEGKAGVKEISRMQEEVRVPASAVTAAPTSVHDKKSCFVPIYKSKLEDRNWANSGMVATVLEGESTLSLQQRIQDAGFVSINVTPMGGDRVFLHATHGKDIWQVFNGAVHFFGVIFNNIHRWSVTHIKYECGA